MDIYLKVLFRPSYLDWLVGWRMVTHRVHSLLGVSCECTFVVSVVMAATVSV